MFLKFYDFDILGRFADLGLQTPTQKLAHWIDLEVDS